MCGIYGMVSLGGAPLAHPDAMEGMAACLRHRGPDDHRVLAGPEAAMGTERLRITDPRQEAAQPFADPTDTVWLACNGAVYNEPALRARYADYPYRSRSDIEPLLPLVRERGPSGLAEVDGMFAVAVWDATRRRLTLGRDRAGEKPLFYAELGEEIWFASEVRALLEHPTLPRALDPEAVADLLHLGYVREPRTMFAAIRQVPAGTILTFSPAGRAAERYWAPEEFQRAEPLTRREAERRLAGLLAGAVRKQLRADVPVGVFTSGGLDSSLVAALAAERRRSDLVAFTVGFDEPSYDERGAAAAIAGELDIPLVPVRADDDALLAALDTVIDRFAEPLADPAVLPTVLLARAARERVGVVLGGEGADELFGGYPTYLGHRLAPWLGRLPGSGRRLLRGIAGALPTSHEKVPVEFLLKRFLDAADQPAPVRHQRWFGTGLGGGAPEDSQRLPWPERSDGDADVLGRAMVLDYLTYLRDGLLPKVDRATMLASLEARAPFLDAAVTEFALRLPSRWRVHGLTTKWLLKRVARRWLPPAAVHRRKRGLSVPVARWLNGPLRADADRLLAPERLRAAGVLDVARVGELVSQHRRGRANQARALWPLLVLARWRERWVGE